MKPNEFGVKDDDILHGLLNHAFKMRRSEVGNGEGWVKGDGKGGGGVEGNAVRSLMRSV